MFARVVQAEEVDVNFTKEGEFVYVMGQENSPSLTKVTDLFKVGGYKLESRNFSDFSSAVTATDTWCSVKIASEREILLSCYTPHQGRGVMVQDHLATFNTDYSQVVPMIEKLRGEQRKALEVLKIK